jgi:virulence-associated protein VapD
LGFRVQGYSNAQGLVLLPDAASTAMSNLIYWYTMSNQLWWAEKGTSVIYTDRVEDAASVKATLYTISRHYGSVCSP